MIESIIISCHASRVDIYLLQKYEDYVQEVRKKTALSNSMQSKKSDFTKKKKNSKTDVACFWVIFFLVYFCFGR